MDVSQLQSFGDSAAAVYGVPQDLFRALIQSESSWNPATPPSSKGAQGIAQFMPDTAARYSVNVNDPYSSLKGAAAYLADIMKTQVKPAGNPTANDWMTAVGIYKGKSGSPGDQAAYAGATLGAAGYPTPAAGPSPALGGTSGALPTPAPGSPPAAGPQPQPGPAPTPTGQPGQGGGSSGGFWFNVGYFILAGAFVAAGIFGMMTGRAVVPKVPV